MREALCRAAAGANLALHNAVHRRRNEARGRNKDKGDTPWTICTAIILKISRKG